MLPQLLDPIYQKEILRKSIHISLGVITAILIANRILRPFHLFLVLAFIIILSFIQQKRPIPIVSSILKRCDRPDHFPAKGMITYFIGMILSLELFPLPVALASIMVLALGDGTAALARPWSKRKVKLSNKHLLEETLVGITFGAIGAVFFVSIPQAIIASSCAMILEAVEVRFNNELLDDNILTPLAAGTSLLLLAKFALF
ncbi:MAG: hypothetical protein HY817_05275 [Candidatus Abawacabacteria bacterium]|nr:hypothetical protein [Candidatus Abawacabacteria bacterium]